MYFTEFWANVSGRQWNELLPFCQHRLLPVNMLSRSWNVINTFAYWRGVEVGCEESRLLTGLGKPTHIVIRSVCFLRLENGDSPSHNYVYPLSLLDIQRLKLSNGNTHKPGRLNERVLCIVILQFSSRRFHALFTICPTQLASDVTVTLTVADLVATTYLPQFNRGHIFSKRFPNCTATIKREFWRRKKLKKNLE